MPGPIGVTLRPYFAPADYRWAGACRLRVAAVDAVGMDPFVFLYRRLPRNPYTGRAELVFEGVAGPVELAEVPVGTPDLAAGPDPVVRWSAYEIDLPTVGVAHRAWAVTQERVAALVLALRRLAVLRAAPAVRVGDPLPGVSDSTSDSLWAPP